MQFKNNDINTFAIQHGILCPCDRLFYVDSILCGGFTDCLEVKRIDGCKSARYFNDATEECWGQKVQAPTHCNPVLYHIAFHIPTPLFYHSESALATVSLVLKSVVYQFWIAIVECLSAKW